MYQTILKEQIFHSVDHKIETNERRKSKRIGVNTKAIISLEGLNLCNCIVKDISNTGARILVANQSWIPRNFLIAGLLPDEFIRVSRVWQDGEQFGVEFSNVTWLSEWIEKQNK